MFREIRDKSFFFFFWCTHKLGFLEASLWKSAIKRVIPMLIHACEVLLTCEQEKWTSSQGLWVFRVFLSTGAFWIQLFSHEAKAYCGHALVLCCDMSINKSVSSPSYMAALFPFLVYTSHSLILLFLLINGEMVLKDCACESISSVIGEDRLFLWQDSLSFLLPVPRSDLTQWAN